jgi:hypothetical protein
VYENDSLTYINQLNNNQFRTNIFLENDFHNDRVIIYLNDSIIFKNNVTTNKSSGLAADISINTVVKAEQNLKIVVNRKYCVRTILKNRFYGIRVFFKNKRLKIIFTNKSLIYD